MIQTMRLFQHRDTWYIYHQGKRRSLKTKDGRKAKGIFKALEREYLYGEARKVDTGSSFTLSKFLETYLETRGDLSPATRRQDKIALSALRDHAGDIPVSHITRETIDGFKADCSARMKPVSVNSYLRHIKAALNYAVENGYLDTAPTIKMLKTGSRLPRVISQPDLARILKEASPEMRRVILVALWTGARRTELVRMRYEHKTGGMIRIIGKGNKERVVPMVGAARDILTAQDIGPVFSHKHPSTISNYFRKTVRAAGVEARFHDIRHTAATNMLAHGVNLAVVQKILGHASITTTQIYADVLEETLMAEMSKMDKTK